MGEWSKVRVNGLEGYVMSKYLSDTSSGSTLYVRTNTGRGLNLRDLPSLEATSSPASSRHGGDRSAARQRLVQGER